MSQASKNASGVLSKAASNALGGISSAFGRFRRAPAPSTPEGEKKNESAAASTTEGEKKNESAAASTTESAITGSPSPTNKPYLFYGSSGFKPGNRGENPFDVRRRMRSRRYRKNRRNTRRRR